MKGGKIILSIVLALVAGLGMGSFLGQTSVAQPAGQDSLPLATIASAKTSENLAGWTTYTNQKYGFAINYPSHWSVTDQTGRFCLMIAFAGPKQEQGAVVIQVAELIDPEELYVPIVTKDYTMENLTSKQLIYIKNKTCYLIACAAPSNNFRAMDQNYFKPMIASFMFTTS